MTIVLPTEKLMFADTRYRHLFGLMFKIKKPSYSLLFKFQKHQRVFVNMWYVFFPLKIIFLDQEMNILEITEAKPFRNLESNSRLVFFMLEIPEGVFDKEHFVVGEKLVFPNIGDFEKKSAFVSVMERLRYIWW